MNMADNIDRVNVGPQTEDQDNTACKTKYYSKFE